jgi:type IV pilus assembly protein PilN
MIKINLLPYRNERKAEKIIQLAVVSAAPILLLVVIMIAVWIFNKSQINGVENQIAEINKQIEACAVQMKEIDNYKSKKEVLTKKMDVITNLTKGKDGPVHLLDELSTAIPGNLWLTSIKQKGLSLEIEGKAIDHIAVSNYMINLEKSPYISNVDLKTISTDAGGPKDAKSGPLKSFVITCTTSNTPEKTG